MKKFLITVFTLLLCTPCFCEESLLSSCIKTYPVSENNLYMLTLSILNSNGQYDVTEIQSKSGYIKFRVLAKDYLITISKNGANSSIIKILPANSNFSGGTVVQKSVFDLIEANLNSVPKQVL